MKHIEKDPALERRFRQVKVPEPTVDEATEILKGLRERYETHHRVQYADEALSAAAELSHKYIRSVIKEGGPMLSAIVPCPFRECSSSTLNTKF
jgi:hypothetical protein